jgi:hypothetical protein
MEGKRPFINAKIVILILAIVLATGYGHQPRFIMGQIPTRDNPIIVKQPTISKAFYGELKDTAAYFKVVLHDTLSIYLNLLVPDIDTFRDYKFSADLLDSAWNLICRLDSGQAAWKPFYEKYGKDNYLMGPETRVPLKAGTYYIRVFNAVGAGRYALATGEKESFPLLEIWRAIRVMPKLKKHFFNKR